MPSVWTYPWTLYDEGLHSAFETLNCASIDRLSVATHYHSVRSLQPRLPDALFRKFSAGCYFDPTSAEYDSGPIAPVQNEIEGASDPLADITTTATKYDFTVNAWTVCLHNSTLGARHREFCLTDAFGNRHEHAFCQSHPEVREYFASLASDISRYDVGEIQLEAIGNQSVFHGHDTEFGHDKRQVITQPSAELLLSQCFCSGCRDAASAFGVDLERARDVVRSLIGDVLADPATPMLSLASLVQEYEALSELLEFRVAMTDRFLSAIVNAASLDVNCYIRDGFGLQPGDGWPAGVTLRGLEEHLDRVTALCYVGDPETVRKRVSTLKTAVDVPVDVGISVDPSIITSYAQFQSVVDAANEVRTGKLMMYNHALATDAHLEWFGRAFS